MEALHASQADHGAFDLIDAHAMYALYRQEVDPGIWSDSDFIKTMDTYYETVLKPRDIELKQATAWGITYSLLTKGDQILLLFTPEGAWANYAPDGWNDQSQQIWVDAGGPVEIVIGPGNLPYLARLDPDTREVTAYLNPIDTKLDNIANQWVPVVDGIAQMRWDGKALISIYDRRTKQGDLVPLLAIGDRGRLMTWDQAKNDYQSVQVMVETFAGTAPQSLKAERIEVTSRGLAAFDSQDNVIFLVDAAGKTFAAADNAISFDSGKLAWDKAAESSRPGCPDCPQLGYRLRS